MSESSRREQLDQVVNEITSEMRTLRDTIEQTVKDLEIVSRLANQQQPANSPQAALGGATESFSGGSNFSGLAGTGVSRSLDGVEDITAETESRKNELDKLCSNEGLRHLSKVAFGDSDDWAEKNTSNPDDSLLAEDALR